MDWKKILKEDSPKIAPVDEDYVSEGEYGEKGQRLFDEKNIGKIYRNKVDGENYIFEKLLANGDIILRPAIDDEERNEPKTLREAFERLMDETSKLNSPASKKAIEATKEHMETLSDKVLDENIRLGNEEKSFRIFPEMAFNFYLVPEQ